jgi:FAD/FMN-containing dehydrogenase
LLGIEDVEVVVVGVGELAPLAQQLPQAGLQPGIVAAVFHRDQQRAHLQAAGDAPLQRAQRHQHRVVLIVAHRGLTFRGEHADHRARELLDAQGLAEAAQTERAAEDLAAYRFADDAYGGAGALFIVLEQAPGGELPVAGDKTRHCCCR